VVSSDLNDFVDYSVVERCRNEVADVGFGVYEVFDFRYW
jgi:hypothetical protein